MPYRLLNTTGNPKMKNKVPLTINFDDGFGVIVKHTIQPGEHLDLHFIPKIAAQLRLRDCLHIEFITEQQMNQPIVPVTPINTVPTDIPVIEDFIKDEEPESEEGKKTRVKRSKNEERPQSEEETE